jgi:hypothetical protein
MNIILIEQQWHKIDKNAQHKSIRLSNECKSDIYLSIDNNSKRRLILSLPRNMKLNINDDIKEYISIQYYDLSNHLIVTLVEDRFYDVFNAFIVSVFFKVKAIPQPVDVANEIVKSYFDWSEFFKEKLDNRLSLTDLLGIIGELFFLRREIIKANALLVNDILKAWMGPYGKGHDFVFDDFDVEIKTIEYSKTEIVISSEYQLESIAGKRLELKVLKTEINGGQGEKLSEFIEKIRNSVIEKLGDLSILFRGLQKHGISIHNMKDYDNYVFKIKDEITYDCNLDGFPKLTSENIPKEISSLNYRLKTNLLGDFITEQITFQNGN